MTNVDITQELPTVISFCSGYGGIERGLDLIGFEHRVIAYVEIEAYAIANLVNKMEAGLLPSAPIYTNLKTFPAHLFRDKVSLITGGYPCQPFSAAGERKGTDDPRHLWPYIRRHIEAIRPLQCFLENVEGHISLGLSSVVSDLEEDGYRTTWGIFSAREVGAPHQRKRVYILADSNGVRCDRGQLPNRVSERSMEIETQQRPEQSVVRSEVKRCCGKARRAHWPPEPGVGRVVDGCPDRVDRIRMLGNAVVPQTAAKAWVTLNDRMEMYR
jgi:DNA (cytosine-5)-methyltransferase 1